MHVSIKQFSREEETNTHKSDFCGRRLFYLATQEHPLQSRMNAFFDSSHTYYVLRQQYLSCSRIAKCVTSIGRHMVYNSRQRRSTFGFKCLSWRLVRRRQVICTSRNGGFLRMNERGHRGEI
jgi:hypothetical protein